MSYNRKRDLPNKNEKKNKSLDTYGLLKKRNEIQDTFNTIGGL